ncbi:hypothetical protein GJ496_000332 [Pomphorhynchus laevis]|nr:hypothetical protein GJ496_000332 [Pomphorhynchus laevis]
MDNFDDKDFAEVRDMFLERNLTINDEGIEDALKLWNAVYRVLLIECKKVMTRRHCRVLTAEHVQLAINNCLVLPRKYSQSGISDSLSIAIRQQILGQGTQQSQQRLPQSSRSGVQTQRCYSHQQQTQQPNSDDKTLTTVRAGFIEEDNILDLKTLLDKPITVCTGPRIKAHWLSFKGVQPLIPENPIENSPEINQHQTAVDNVICGTSIESQMYYKDVTEKSISDDPAVRKRVFQSVSSDPGLYDLLPRLIRFISEGITANIFKRDCLFLSYLVQFARALIKNPNVDIVPYVHVILPSLVSCSLTRQLTVLHPDDTDNVVEWELRASAARTVGLLNFLYKRRLHKLEAQLTNVCCTFLKKDVTPYETLFGAICILSHLGDQIVWMHIAPNATEILQRLEHSISSHEFTSINAAFCYKKLIHVLSNVYQNRISQCKSDSAAIMEERQQVVKLVGPVVLSTIESELEKNELLSKEYLETIKITKSEILNLESDVQPAEKKTRQPEASFLNACKANRFPTEPLFGSNCVAPFKKQRLNDSLR